MNEIELKKLHDKIQSVKDFGDFNKFKNKMSDVDSRKRFYDKYYLFLKSKGVNLGPYGEYERRLSSNVETDGGGGNSDGGNSGGRIVSGRYHNCPTGPYTQGCRSEVVRKVQKCIGVKDDSLFGPKTQGALESKGFKNGFTDTDVSKLCSNNPEENKPEETPIKLPDWANCLKVLTKAKLTQDSKGEEIVINPFGSALGYFWSDFTFLYVSKEGGKFYGKWSCKNNSLVINTEDGEVWTLSSGWVTAPDKTETPDTNFDPTWVDSDDFSLSNQPQETSTKTESDMNDLENIINEVNSLIIEQTQQIVQAPKDELAILTTISINFGIIGTGVQSRFK